MSSRVLAFVLLLGLPTTALAGQDDVPGLDGLWVGALAGDDGEPLGMVVLDLAQASGRRFEGPVGLAVPGLVLDEALALALTVDGTGAVHGTGHGEAIDERGDRLRVSLVIDGEMVDGALVANSTLHLSGLGGELVGEETLGAAFGVMPGPMGDLMWGQMIGGALGGLATYGSTSPSGSVLMSTGGTTVSDDALRMGLKQAGIGNWITRSQIISQTMRQGGVGDWVEPAAMALYCDGLDLENMMEGRASVLDGFDLGSLLDGFDFGSLLASELDLPAADGPLGLGTYLAGGLLVRALDGEPMGVGLDEGGAVDLVMVLAPVE